MSRGPGFYLRFLNILTKHLKKKRKEKYSVTIASQAAKKLWQWQALNRSLLSPGLSPNHRLALGDISQVRTNKCYKEFYVRFHPTVIDGLCLECIHSWCGKVQICLQLKPTHTSQGKSSPCYGHRKWGHCHAWESHRWLLTSWPSTHGKCFWQRVKKQ